MTVLISDGCNRVNPSLLLLDNLSCPEKSAGGQVGSDTKNKVFSNNKISPYPVHREFVAPYCCQK